MTEVWKWTFLGFESALDGQPVQAWFDGLPGNDKDEIIYLLVHMQNITDRLWRKPEFDRLIGAGGISEIRVPDLRHSEGAVTYRIYGYFGPGKREYTFLHGTEKEVKNDEDGKRIAKHRLDQLRLKEATIHKFNFARSSLVEVEKRTGSKD